jgi:hypothetical protein
MGHHTSFVLRFPIKDETIHSYNKDGPGESANSPGARTKRSDLLIESSVQVRCPHCHGGWVFEATEDSLEDEAVE